MPTVNYDLVVFGASSFVGKILTQHLFKTYDVNQQLKWAIAGRSEQKLKDLRECLGAQAQGLDIIVADSFNRTQLENLCRQTKVVISTVGPYALYGDLLIDVCIQTATHYCDLCGEVQWIHKMINQHQTTAQEKNAHLINSCGFDSIPSDFGVYYLQQQAQLRYGEPCHKISMRCKAIKGGLSGGTIYSMLNIANELAKDKSLLKIIANPYSLCGTSHPFTQRQAVLNGAFYDKDFHSWCSPFLMAGINTRIVHRTNLLNNSAYGKDFLYSEASLTGAGFKGWFKAKLRSISMKLFFIATAIKPLRHLLTRFVLPKPGEGPSESAQRAGFYDLRFIGHTPSGKTLQIKVTGDRDPGYASTAKMLAQAGIGLAFEKHRRTQGGLYTPASFFESDFIEALEAHAGLSFSVIE